MSTISEYPQVCYLETLPLHWIVNTAPGEYWMVGESQSWSQRTRYLGYASALQRPSPQTARLLLSGWGLSQDAYTARP